MSTRKALFLAGFAILLTVIVMLLHPFGSNNSDSPTAQVVSSNSPTHIVGNFNSCPTVEKFSMALGLPQAQLEVDTYGGTCAVDWFQGRDVALRQNFICGVQWICELGYRPYEGRIEYPQSVVVDGDGVRQFQAYQAVFFFKSRVNGVYWWNKRVPVQCQIYHIFWNPYAYEEASYVPAPKGPVCKPDTSWNY